MRLRTISIAMLLAVTGRVCAQQVDPALTAAVVAQTAVLNDIYNTRDNTQKKIIAAEAAVTVAMERMHQVENKILDYLSNAQGAMQNIYQIKRAAELVTVEIPQDPLCGFHVPGILANRKITDSEMEDFLAGNAQVLDGFSNNEGKIFSSVLTLAEDGKVVMDSRIAVCPVCGGDILVSPQAFNCSNYSNPQVKCKFMAWRNIAGHVITKQEMVEICEEGQTREPLELYKNNGAIFYKRLGLSTDKKSIIKI